MQWHGIVAVLLVGVLLLLAGVELLGCLASVAGDEFTTLPRLIRQCAPPTALGEFRVASGVALGGGLYWAGVLFLVWFGGSICSSLWTLYRLYWHRKRVRAYVSGVGTPLVAHKMRIDTLYRRPPGGT